MKTNVCHIAIARLHFTGEHVTKIKQIYGKRNIEIVVKLRKTLARGILLFQGM